MGWSDEPQFRDTLFRNKKKNGEFRIVEPPTPPLEAPVADTHAHLDMLPDAPLALARAAAHRVSFVCSIVDVYENDSDAYDLLDGWLAQAAQAIPEIMAAGSCGPEASEDGPAVPHVRMAIGCHPHNAKYYDRDLEKRLIARLRDPRTSALGEVGLDYHYDFSPREAQREAFKRQIALAHETGLPLMLHLREAHDEALQIMDEEGFPEAGTLLHCFNLDWETLEPWLERGCSAAFGGALTFKKSADTRAALAKMPIGRIMTETDAPYMAPEPLRGMACSPDQTIFTARLLAETLGCEPGAAREGLLRQIYLNALRFLDRPPTPWQADALQEQGTGEGLPAQACPPAPSEEAAAPRSPNPEEGR